eukprot:TRINITY_DN820_c0_g2_i13.p1 TRINITY_DN820_c0_g2~~TRINITY_DN820_c0_g2_i13.p1  ORF type:complete len:925 (-),score=19.58 TRINITY_DN820_c0_g2_i13:316-3090(-)
METFPSCMGTAGRPVCVQHHSGRVLSGVKVSIATMAQSGPGLARGVAFSGEEPHCRGTRTPDLCRGPQGGVPVCGQLFSCSKIQRQIPSCGESSAFEPVHRLSVIQDPRDNRSGRRNPEGSWLLGFHRFHRRILAAAPVRAYKQTPGLHIRRKIFQATGGPLRSLSGPMALHTRDQTGLGTPPSHGSSLGCLHGRLAFFSLNSAAASSRRAKGTLTVPISGHCDKCPEVCSRTGPSPPASGFPVGRREGLGCCSTFQGKRLPHFSQEIDVREHGFRTRSCLSCRFPRISQQSCSLFRPPSVFSARLHCRIDQDRRVGAFCSSVIRGKRRAPLVEAPTGLPSGPFLHSSQASRLASCDGRLLEPGGFLSFQGKGTPQFRNVHVSSRRGFHGERPLEGTFGGGICHSILAPLRTRLRSPPSVRLLPGRIQLVKGKLSCSQSTSSNEESRTDAVGPLDLSETAVDSRPVQPGRHAVEKRILTGRPRPVKGVLRPSPGGFSLAEHRRLCFTRLGAASKVSVSVRRRPRLLCLPFPEPGQTLPLPSPIGLSDPSRTLETQRISGDGRSALPPQLADGPLLSNGPRNGTSDPALSGSVRDPPLLRSGLLSNGDQVPPGPFPSGSPRSTTSLPEVFTSLLEARISASTRRAYSAHQKAWRSFCAEHHFDPFDFSKARLAMFITHLFSCGRNANYISNSLAALRSLAISNAISISPFKDVRLRAMITGASKLRPHAAVRYQSTLDGTALLNAVRVLPLPQNYEELLDRSLLLILFFASARPADLATARLSLLRRDLDRVTIVCRPKEAKGGFASRWIDRGTIAEICPIHHLELLLSSRPHSSSDSLFVNAQGDPLSAPQISSRVRSLLRLLGSDAPTSILRGAGASHLIRSGVPPENVFLRGGWHSWKNFTTHYVRSAPQMNVTKMAEKMLH